MRKAPAANSIGTSIHRKFQASSLRRPREFHNRTASNGPSINAKYTGAVARPKHASIAAIPLSSHGTRDSVSYVARYHTTHSDVKMYSDRSIRKSGNPPFHW